MRKLSLLLSFLFAFTMAFSQAENRSPQVNFWGKIKMSGANYTSPNTPGTILEIGDNNSTGVLRLPGFMLGNIASPAERMLGYTNSKVYYYNGLIWQYIGDSTDLASKVPITRTINGYDLSANRTLTTSDILEGTNLYHTVARVRAALSFVAGSGGYNSTTGVITIPTNTNQLINGNGFITENQTITLSGDISGSGKTAITATLPNVNSNVGTYNNITINAKGQAVAGSNVSYLTSYTETDPTIYAWAKAATKPSYSYGEISGTPTTWAWSNLTGVPSTFTPSAHTHPISDITSLQTSLDSKLGATITTATTGQLIRYNGSAWVNWTPNFLTAYTETDPVYLASSWYSTTNNSSNWNTAYTDRNQWDGGATGLVAATGRTSLGLGTMAVESATNYYTSTQIQNYFSGASAMTGYNKSNWDAAYSWGNWASGSHYIGTTLIANNRASASQTLAGVSIDGTAAYATNWGGFQADFNVVASTFDYIPVRDLAAGKLKLAGSAAIASYISGQAMNIAGYATSETLATVTGRGNTTTTMSWFNGGLGFDQPGVRSWTYAPSGGNMVMSSGDGNGGFIFNSAGVTVNGRLFAAKTGQTAYTSAALEVYTSDGGETGISFHRGGVSAGFLSHGSYGGLRWNGDQVLLSSMSSVTPTASSLVLRDGSGYVEAVYYKSTNTNISGGAILALTGKNTTVGDSYMYEFNATAVRTFLGMPSSGETLASVTGRGASTSTASYFNGGVYASNVGVYEMTLSSNQLYRASANEMYLNYSGSGQTIIGNAAGVGIYGATTVNATFTAAGTIYAAATGGNIYLTGTTAGQVSVSGSTLYLADWATGLKGLQINLTTGTSTLSGGGAMTGGWNKTLELSATFPVLTFNSANTKWAAITYDYSSNMIFKVNSTSSDVMYSGINAMLINSASGNISMYNNLTTGGDITSNNAYLTSYLFIGSKLALRGTDTYLRLNQNGEFTTGVYTPGNLRTDGVTYFGGTSYYITGSTAYIPPTTINGSATVNGYVYPYAIVNQSSVGADNGFGVFFGTLSEGSDYVIRRRAGSWASPYQPLDIKFYTGIRIGADYNYGGTIFYSSSNLATALFSVGSYDTNIRMHVGGQKLITYNAGSGVEIEALQASYFGYSSGYAVLQIGDTRSNRSIAFGVDLTGNTSGAFNGGGSEYIWKNVGSFKTPNASNNGYNTLYAWNSSGQVTFNDNVYSNGAFVATGNIYLGARSAWLSDWLNQALKTTDAPTFAGLTLTGALAGTSAMFNSSVRVGSSTSTNLLLGPVALEFLNNGSYSPATIYSQGLTLNNGGAVVFYVGNTGTVTVSGTTIINSNQIYLPSGSFHVNYSGSGQTHIGNTGGGIYFYQNTDFNNYSIGNALNITANNGVYAGTLYSNTLRNTAGEGIVSYSSNVNYIGGGASAHSLAFYAGGANRMQLSTGGSLVQNTQVVYPNAKWGASSATGPVVIKIPGSSSNYGMIQMTIQLYEYNSNAASTITVGGHNWSGQWYYMSADVVGYTNKSVRFGFKDGQYCIILGDASSVWSYGQVVVSRVQNGEYYSGTIDLGGTWSVAVESDSYTWNSGDYRYLRTPKGMSLMDGVMKIGVDATYGTTYNAIGFGGSNTTNADNKIFAAANNSAGLFINAASGQNVYLRSGGSEIGYGNTNNWTFPQTTGSSSTTSGALTVAGGIASASQMYSPDYYATSWFRNTVANTGLYNQVNGNHIYSTGQFWAVTAGGSSSGGIQFYSNHASGLKGYVYFDGNGFGLLNNSGQWAVRTVGGNTDNELYGTWKNTTQLNLSANGASPENGYGALTITNAAFSNYSYIGFIRTGIAALGMGMNTSNEFWVGSVTGGGTASVLTGAAYMQLSGAKVKFSGDVQVNESFGLMSQDGTKVFKMYNSGVTFNSTITATAFYQSSDLRLKNVISRSGDMITYTWKDNRDLLLHYGYAAQEKEIDYPNQISTDKEGMKAVNYTEVHTKKINDLEKEVAELKLLVNKLLNNKQ